MKLTIYARDYVWFIITHTDKYERNAILVRRIGEPLIELRVTSAVLHRAASSEAKYGSTDVVQPGQLPGGRVGSHVALEVHVVPLLDVAGRQRAAQPQPHHRRVCNQHTAITITVLLTRCI